MPELVLRLFDTSRPQMIILPLFIIAIAISLVVVGYKVNRAAAKCNHFPGISLIEFFRDARNLPLRTAYYNEKFAKVVTPVVTLVLATHPDSVKFVLNDTDKFPKTVLDTFKNSSKIFGNNIVFSNGQQWRQYRNVLSPPFHFDAVKKWIPDFRKLTLDLMEQWAKISDKPIDIMYWVPLFTLDVLGVTVLSRNFNAMKGEESDDLAAVNVILANANKPLMLLLGYIEKKLGLNIVRKINNSIDYITGSMNDIVNTRKAMKIKDENHHYDLIDVMLAAHDPDWTERDLISNAFIMFVAGHETTATALGWMFYYLSTLPEIQNKLKEEVDRVLKGQPITQDNIRELTYMSNVIKENLRIQPPVAYLPTRDVKEDVYFEGKLIPKGSIIGLNIYSIHHSPELWSEPEKFDPDRFTKPTVPFGFLPFSLKSRACLGNQFSLVEQTVFLATLMQHYKVTLHSHVPAPEVAGINKVGNIKVNLSKW